jgi:hypothetical protein
MSETRGAHKPAACITVDLDTLQCYRDIHGLDAGLVGHEGDPTYRVGVRRMLDFFDEHKIEATLFVIGRDTSVPVHRNLLKEAFQAGHEIGNHTYSHYYDLNERPVSELQSEVARAEGAIASVTGRRPRGFRAPGYNITPELLEICRSRDYAYDSSIFASPPYYVAKSAIMAWQRFKGRPSRSSQTDPSNLLAPITPYRPDLDKIWKRAGSGAGTREHREAADGELWEVPICLVPGIRFPVIGTSLHLLGDRGFDAIYPALRRRHTELFNLEFHAIDFIDASDLPDQPGPHDRQADRRLADYQPDISIPWQVKRRRYEYVVDRLREDYEFRTMGDAVSRLRPD